MLRRNALPARPFSRICFKVHQTYGKNSPSHPGFAVLGQFLNATNALPSYRSPSCSTVLPTLPPAPPLDSVANLKTALKKITGKEPKESDGGVFSDADAAKALELAQERLSKTAASLDAGAKASEDKKPPSPGDDHTREEVCGFVSPP